jgi:hypothetical protein
MEQPGLQVVYDNPLWIYLWDILEPFLISVYSWANTIGAILVVYYFAVYWRAKLKKAELEKELAAKQDAKFDWMKDRAPVLDPRWSRIDKLAQSQSSSDWRVAIMEADAIMDEIIEGMGLPGETMGERMKAMAKSDFPLLDSAWEVHRLRNKLAHEAGYDLKKREAESAIDTYHRIFRDVGFIPG